jgi:fimbrial chaperone protein
MLPNVSRLSRPVFFFAFLLMVTLLSVRPAFAAPELQPQLSVWPITFEGIEIGEAPVNETIKVRNLKKRPVTMHAEVYTWTHDDKFEVKLVPPTPQSLDQWMVVNPLRFTIPAGGEQTIRFSIRPRVKPEPGEHRAILYLSEEESAEKKEHSIQMLARYGIGIYGHVQPIKREASLTGFSFDRKSGTLAGVVRNGGNVHARLRGSYSVWKQGAFPGLKAARELPVAFEGDVKKPEGLIVHGTFAGGPTLPGFTRTYTSKLAIPANSGAYVVAFTGELDGAPVDKVIEGN